MLLAEDFAALCVRVGKPQLLSSAFLAHIKMPGYNGVKPAGGLRVRWLCARDSKWQQKTTPLFGTYLINALYVDAAIAVYRHLVLQRGTGHQNAGR